MTSSQAANAVRSSQLTPASTPRRLAAAALDVGAMIAAAAIACGIGALVGFTWPGMVIPVGFGLVATLIWLGIRHLRSGATPGAALIGLCRVGHDGLPVLGRSVAYDTRIGKDPLVLEPQARRTLARAAVPWERRIAPAEGLGLIADDRSWLPLQRATILGRVPQAVPGDSVALLGFTDVSRSMSRSHVRLEPLPAGVAVIDLSSTNGSRLRGEDGVATPLQPGVPVTMEIGQTLELGDRRFVLETTTHRRAWAGGEA